MATAPVFVQVAGATHTINDDAKRLAYVTIMRLQQVILRSPLAADISCPYWQHSHPGHCWAPLVGQPCVLHHGKSELSDVRRFRHLTKFPLLRGSPVEGIPGDEDPPAAAAAASTASGTDPRSGSSSAIGQAEADLTQFAIDDVEACVLAADAGSDEAGFATGDCADGQAGAFAASQAGVASEAGGELLSDAECAAKQRNRS